MTLALPGQALARTGEAEALIKETSAFREKLHAGPEWRRWSRGAAVGAGGAPYQRVRYAAGTTQAIPRSHLPFRNSAAGTMLRFERPSAPLMTSAASAARAAERIMVPTRLRLPASRKSIAPPRNAGATCRHDTRSSQFVEEVASADSDVGSRERRARPRSG